MTNVLVVFESKYGQAKKIATFITDSARRRGLDVRMVPVDAARAFGVDGRDAVIVVAPVYLGRHPAKVGRFLRDHAHVLSATETAFVSVSNSAANPDPAARANAARIATAFLEKARVRARLVLTAGGAFAYPRYGFIVRLVMKAIARKTGGPLDTSRIHELTDWDALGAAIVPFLTALERHPRPGEANGEARTAPDTSGVFRTGGKGPMHLRRPAGVGHGNGA